MSPPPPASAPSRRPSPLGDMTWQQLAHMTAPPDLALLAEIEAAGKAEWDEMLRREGDRYDFAAVSLMAGFTPDAMRHGLKRPDAADIAEAILYREKTARRTGGRAA